MGLQVGGSHSSQSGSGTTDTSPVIPDSWQNAYDTFGKALNGQGFTTTQQPGVNALTDSVANGQTANTLNGYNTNYLQNFADRGAQTLGGLAAKAAAGTPGYESYAALTPVSAQSISADQVTANQGNKYMSDYQNPYTSQVVDASLGDLKNSYDRNMVNSGMASAAGGAFGGGRQGIREAQMADDYQRNVAGTSANLRNQGFNTAAGFGMQDADRFLQGDVANQGANLNAANMNAQNDLNAQQYNNSMQNQRQQFDIGSVYQNTDQRMGALDRMAGNTVNANSITQGNAGNLINAGGQGTDQLSKFLAMGIPTFGSHSDTTSKGSGSQVGASAGGK